MSHRNLKFSDISLRENAAVIDVRVAPYKLVKGAIIMPIEPTKISEQSRRRQTREANLAAALQHARAGYAVFPARPDKRPYLKGWHRKATTDEDIIREWWRKFPDAVPAIVTGKKNNIAVLDVDLKNGKDGFRELRKLGIDPDRLSGHRCNTPSGGAHFYFVWPEGMGNSASGLPAGVDVRAEGGFVIAPGAVTPAGKYEPEDNIVVDELLGLNPWPDELCSEISEQSGPSVPAGIPLEILHDALMAIPNDNPDRDWWLKFGAALHFETGGSAEGLESWDEWSALHCSYDPIETKRVWKSYRRREGNVCTGKTIIHEARKHGWQDPSTAMDFEEVLDSEVPESEVRESLGFDENSVIHAFTVKYDGTLLFDHSAGCWYRYDGSVWRREETKLALHRARKMATHLAKDNSKAKALLKVSSWESIERGARSDRAFAVTADRWNRDPWLLGTPGGTVDLRTGEIRPGDPDDCISRCTAVAPILLDKFVFSRDCPQWQKFLNEALDGDPEAIRFIQMWFGYSLTGVTTEQALLFVYGPGGSGKSTAINTAAEVAGEYAISVATSTLTANKHVAHAEELARLDGPRMAWASETEKGRAWAENRIKNLTGGDKITARFMRQNSFEFKPQFKLVIVGNNQPSLTNIDEAIKRRFLILPFDHAPKKKDEMLSQKLRAEWPGILSWMIQGCLDWHKNGLIRPEVIRRATDAYFAEQDIFSQWIDECCNTGDNLADTSANLWESWSNYACRHGEDSGSRTRTFPETLKQRKYAPIKDKCGIRGRGFRGLAVAKSDESEDDDDADDLS